MHITIKDNCFSNDCIIRREEYVNLPFNTIIDYPENTDVIIVQNDSVKRLKKIESGLLNYKKREFFSPKIDSRKYIVYFISKKHQDAGWGGNIQYEDKKANGIQEKINIRAMFSFSVERGERLLPLLLNDPKEYNKRYLLGKIRLRIGNLIKSYISKELNEYGFIKCQERIDDIALKLMSELNVRLNVEMGLIIHSMNIEIE